jgi:hypothetical protein
MRLELAVFSSEEYVQRLGASIVSYANDGRTFPEDLLAALDRASKQEDDLDYSRYGWMHKDEIAARMYLICERVNLLQSFR